MSLNPVCSRFFSFLFILLTFNLTAGERETQSYFKKIRNEPTLLRNFLYKFPKGDDLHFGRAKVEKMKVLKPVKSKNYFPVDFSFEFERSYVVSEVGGKVRVVKV